MLHDPPLFKVARDTTNIMKFLNEKTQTQQVGKYLLKYKQNVLVNPIFLKHLYISTKSDTA